MDQLKGVQERQEKTRGVAVALNWHCRTNSCERWWNLEFILKVEQTGSVDKVDVVVRCLPRNKKTFQSERQQVFI